jgi:hypothetical protein
MGSCESNRVLSFVFSSILALQTPAVPAAQSPRFAVVVNHARPTITRAAFERWVNDAATRFAARFSVTAVPIPAGDPPSYANPALCNSLGIVGFLVPGRRWHISPTAVSVSARLVVFDCDGDRFFDEDAERSEPRNQAMIPQAQVESVASHATDALLEKFARFESGHQVLWARFLATGSLRDVTPSPQTK